MDDSDALLASVVDVPVTLLTRPSPVVVILAMLITLLAHVVDVLVILANLNFFWTNGLELTQGTGEIFTAKSYYHGNTSKSWVEHRLTDDPAVLDDLAHFRRTFDTCSRHARHAAHPCVTCSRRLRTFGTLLAHVVEVLVILANLNFFWTNGLELTQRS